MNFSDIPREVLTEILSYFTIEELIPLTIVNKKWYESGYESVEQFNLLGNRIDIIDKFPYIEKLKIYSKNMKDEEIEKIFMKESLKRIELYQCKRLKRFKMMNNNIQELCIKNCKQIEEIENIQLYKLVSLFIYECHGIKQEQIENIIEMNPKLEKIELYYMNHIHELKIKHKNIKILKLKHLKELKNIQIECPKLEYLDLSFTKVKDTNIELLCKISKYLKILKLKGCQQLMNPMIEHLSIQKINLDFCKLLNNPLIQCPLLEELNLSNTNIKDHLLEKLIIKNENLKSIIFQKCEKLEYPKIKSNSLEYLNFHGSTNIEEMNIISPNLNKLILNWTKIKDRNIERIIESCPILKYLELKVCDELESPKIKSDLLEYLDFNGSKRLNHPIIECKNLLTSLKIEY